MCKFIIACLISLSALSFSSCTQKKVATSVAYMDFYGAQNETYIED